MAQAFTKMLEIGADNRQALGRAGRARVMEHFRLDSVATQYAALYETVAAPKACELTNPQFRSRSENYSDGASTDTINAAV
jgi:hypothetical protein